jgi:error-prone DNA polymerase
MIWLVHSCYSFLWGVSSPEDLCRRAAERGHAAVVCWSVSRKS